MSAKLFRMRVGMKGDIVAIVFYRETGM